MLRFPTWNWMQLRPASPIPGSQPQSRPCLPSVEKLDRRVLLSASTTVPQVVTGLIRDGINLTESEFAAFIKLDGIKGESLDDKHKSEIQQLGDEFGNLDKIFEQYGEDILTQKILPAQPTDTSASSPGDIVITKPTDVSSALADEFIKINTLATDLNDLSDGLLLPAVQNIQNIAMGDGSAENGGFLGDLTGLLNSGLVSQVPPDDLMGYVKMGQEFIKIDEALMDFKTDVILGAPIDDQIKVTMDKTNQEFLKITLENATISSADQVPPDFVTGLQGEIDGLITGNTIGGTGGGDTLV